MKDIVIGIDIGGTNTVYGIADRQGDCLYKNSLSTFAYTVVEDYVRALSEDIIKALHRLPDYKLKGIGIGAPNGNYYTGTVKDAPNLIWKGTVNFTALFNKYFSVPVKLTNDANAAAIGEMIYGAAKAIRDFVIVTLGTGVGSGFVIDGQVLYGYTGFAGELGHTIIEENGRICGCGRKGCLEMYASARGVILTYLDLLKQFNLKQPDVNINTEFIYKEALKGSEAAIKTFDYTGKKLGFALANTVAITSPEAIFLFGGITGAGAFLFEPALKYMNQYMLPVFSGSVKLLPSGVPAANAAVLGAAALAW